MYDSVSLICGKCAAAKLGISSPPPYLSLSMNDDALLKGVNYASGGAGILNDTGLYFVKTFLPLVETSSYICSSHHIYVCT